MSKSLMALETKVLKGQKKPSQRSPKEDKTRRETPTREAKQQMGKTRRVAPTRMVKDRVADNVTHLVACIDSSIPSLVIHQRRNKKEEVRKAKGC